MSVLPFGNALTTFQIKGSLLLEILKDSVARSVSIPDFGGHLIFGGLFYSYNPGAAVSADKRVIEVAIWNKATKTLNNLDLTIYYQMTINSYTFNGGDSYSHFKNGTRDGQIVNVNQLGMTESVALLSYVKQIKTISSQLDYDVQCPQQANLPIVRGGINNLDVNLICPIITSTSALDYLKKCPSNVQFCKGGDKDRAVNLLKKLVGSNVDFINKDSVIGDPCDTCSGLGSCSNQICSCQGKEF